MQLIANLAIKLVHALQLMHGAKQHQLAMVCVEMELSLKMRSVMMESIMV